jgi:AbiU2
MTDDDRFKRWGERILKIHEHILDAIVNRRIHNEVGEILQANPRLWRDNNSFFVWIAATYEASVLMAVRRQIDLHKDKPISLAWLLKEIIAYPHVLSRERFVSRYSPGSEGAANREFDHLVAPSANYINPDVVRTELCDLREQTKLIEDYTDKRVAHFDAKGPKDSPTVLQIHNVLDRLHELRAKYMYLLRAERWAEPELHDETTWKAIFREPWIPRGS